MMGSCCWFEDGRCGEVVVLRLRVVEIDSQNEIFRYSGSGFVDHRIITAMNQLAWLNPRAGIVTVGSGELNRFADWLPVTQ